jgi:hypothetical protein
MTTMLDRLARAAYEASPVSGLGWEQVQESDAWFANILRDRVRAVLAELRNLPPEITVNAHRVINQAGSYYSYAEDVMRAILDAITAEKADG